MPKLAERAPDRLTDEQVGRILEGLPEPHALLVRLALLTGIRRGELMDLHWRHFVKLPRPHLLLEGTKSGKVRRVPLSLEAETVLDRIKESTTSVCISFHRNPNAQSVVRMSGLKWHWHQLRHTFACRYLEAGGRLSALQMILGHSTSRMTERYAKLSDEAVFDDMDRIGKATSDGTNDGTPKEVISKRLAQEQ
jgi:integrase